MYIVIIDNGMKKRVVPGTTVEDYKKTLAAAFKGDDIFIKDAKTKKMRRAKPKEVLKAGTNVMRAPKITKGDDSRVAAEVEVLKEAVRAFHYNVVAGVKKLDNIRYISVTVEEVFLGGRFEPARTDIMFMLPPNYPSVPPIGCYLKFPHKTKEEEDHHFTLRAHYGAPSLTDDGWYWYCVGLGADFADRGYSQGSDVHNVWKPGSTADGGHNLVTLLTMAIFAITNIED